jgi:hypothetical protein
LYGREKAVGALAAAKDLGPLEKAMSGGPSGNKTEDQAPPNDPEVIAIKDLKV